MNEIQYPVFAGGEGRPDAVYDAIGNTVCICKDADFARRVAACLNACKDIKTERLEDEAQTAEK